MMLLHLQTGAVGPSPVRSRYQGVILQGLIEGKLGIVRCLFLGLLPILDGVIGFALLKPVVGTGDRGPEEPIVVLPDVDELVERELAVGIEADEEGGLGGGPLLVQGRLEEVEVDESPGFRLDVLGKREFDVVEVGVGGAKDEHVCFRVRERRSKRKKTFVVVQRKDADAIDHRVPNEHHFSKEYIVDIEEEGMERPVLDVDQFKAGEIESALEIEFRVRRGAEQPELSDLQPRLRQLSSDQIGDVGRSQRHLLLPGLEVDSRNQRQLDVHLKDVADVEVAELGERLRRDLDRGQDLVFGGLDVEEHELVFVELRVPGNSDYVVAETRESCLK